MHPSLVGLKKIDRPRLAKAGWYLRDRDTVALEKSVESQLCGFHLRSASAPDTCAVKDPRDREPGSNLRLQFPVVIMGSRLVEDPLPEKRGVKRAKPETVEAKEKTPKQASLLHCVSQLRSEPSFSDADILVGDETFKVHRNVVCNLSDFFMRVFLGPFKEAEKQSLKVENATSAAVSILLDFAYGVSVVDKLMENFGLSKEVVSISHRFQVG